MLFRIATPDDLPAIVKLYKAVTQNEAGLARLEGEVTDDYVKDFINKSLSTGLIIVGEHPQQTDTLIAEIHGYKTGLTASEHVLTGLATVVHPAHQGKKIGRTIFTIFLEEIARNRPDIGKVEFITRESNTKAIGLCQSLGFRIEGRMEMRIRTPEGIYEADIPMGWQNPNFEF